MGWRIRIADGRFSDQGARGGEEVPDRDTGEVPDDPGDDFGDGDGAAARVKGARGPVGRGGDVLGAQGGVVRGEEGGVLGIIGRNGAGKSTLLKILARITDMTEGEVEIEGRVGSLLEVGTGFHSELTGRENIYLNGAILGMRRREIQGKFDEIVAFAEVEKFLDTPVKHYSSGMYMRLAFAVAAHLEPEILIVDEVLAVGDAQFQKKCLGKMGEVAKGGRTVLFVSHNTAAVQALCARGVLLETGRVRRAGEVSEVVAEYMTQREAAAAVDVGQRRDRTGSGEVRCTSIRVKGAEGGGGGESGAGGIVTPGEPFEILVGYVAERRVASAGVSIDIETADGARVTTLYSGFRKESFDLAAGEGMLRCRVEGLDLRPDRYQLSILLNDANGRCDFVSHAASLEVGAFDFFGTGQIPERVHGPLLCRYSWSAGAGLREREDARSA